MSFGRKLLRLAGADTAVVFTVLWRGWSAVAGLLTLFLVPLYLSPEEQGYYFTFASLVALRVFFELGFGTVVLQFASHEKAVLEWTDTGTLEGQSAAKERLASLFRLVLKWYGVVAICFVAGVLPAGYFFFHSSNPSTQVHWQGPWLVLICATSVLIPISPVLSLLEGCGLVPQIARMRFGDAFLSNIAAWSMLATHHGLAAAPALTIVSALWQSAWLIGTRRALIMDLLATRKTANTIGWADEIWPLQWRIAISWLSGYLIFQLFNPVIFRYWGSVAAGRMGLSVNLTLGILTIGISWVNTKAPRFGVLIAQRRFKELDKLYFASFYQALSVVTMANLAVLATVIYLGLTGHKFSTRVLSPLALACLMGASTVNLFVSSQAVYLRAHKREPFLPLSIASGLCIMMTTFIFGKYYGASAVAISFFLVTLVLSGGWAWRIFEVSRREWHPDPVADEFELLPVPPLP